LNGHIINKDFNNINKGFPIAVRVVISAIGTVIKVIRVSLSAIGTFILLMMASILAVSTAIPGGFR
jgi:hypothetical protein